MPHAAVADLIVDVSQVKNGFLSLLLALELTVLSAELTALVSLMSLLTLAVLTIIILTRATLFIEVFQVFGIIIALDELFHGSKATVGDAGLNSKLVGLSDRST